MDEEQHPLKVLKLFRSSHGFAVVPIHYSHDLEKNEAWRDKEQAKYRRESEDWQADWNREMELDFTSVSGALACPSFTQSNLLAGLEYSAALPLCLTMDFNVEPCIWEAFQIYRGLFCYFDEIKLSPASIEDMTREFRNRYPAHQGELWIYGDATGNGRNPQTGKSDYDLVRLYFRGYSAKLIWKVPAVNPQIKDRLNSFNLKLKGVEGQVGILVDPKKCPELVKDMQEVVVASGKIVKVKDRANPYFYRTHALDAASYPVWREYPVINEVLRSKSDRRRPRKYNRILGQLR